MTARNSGVTDFSPSPVSPLPGPGGWFGAEIQQQDCWQYSVETVDLEEIDYALRRFRGRADSTLYPAKAEFLLGRLESILSSIGRQLENGCGFVRLTGLPLERWSRDELEILWMGIASHIGTPVFQNPDGQLLREITAEPGDVGKLYGQLDTGDGQFLSSRARTASSAELRFHTDRCDIVGLLCTGQSIKGGESRIVSSVTVHNEMLARAPDLCEILYRDMPRSRIGEEIGGENLWYNLPVWGVRAGKFTSHYSRTYIEALEHVPGAPVISEAQWEAMDLLADIAEECSFEMTLEPGDIQFLNNHVIYHSRNAYQDDPANNRVRCLLRIWLSAPHRSLPESHRVLWRETESGKIRGGIGQA
jgi:hypothetical protein